MSLWDVLLTTLAVIIVLRVLVFHPVIGLLLVLLLYQCSA